MTQSSQDALASLNLLRDTDTPYLDIIAIHGILEADPTKTWSTPLTQTPSSTGAVNWLVDDNMLPSQITNLRIWSFQYSTTPLSVREGGLKAHMDSTAIALRRLMHQKILDNSTQSILFIAQGYGGLLALKAVLEHGLGARTIGIVCLGTAFRPVEIENSIADTLPIPGHSSAANSIALSEEFNALPELLSDFRAARGTFLIPIRCFYETEPVRGRSSSRFIVPKQAAVLDDINAISFALDDVDHFTMSKYSGPEDHNYELMCDVLKGLVDNAYPAMLTQATINGDVAYARSIVENHGPSFATNDALNAALKAAVTNGQDRILQMILDANIRVNAPLTAERDTALILAVQSTVPTKLVIVRKLLQKGADVAMLNEDDKSAIQYAVELHDHELEQLLRNRPLIVGPPVRRESYDWIKNPVLSFNDWGSSDGLFAKVADVYEVHGEERTFLRTPSVHDLIYRHGPRHLMNRERSKETEEGVKKFRWLHLPANNMLWMKDLIQRNYREQIPSENLSKDYYLYKCSSILDKSHWEDLITSSPLPELSHIRHLNPRCRTMPYIGDPPDKISADMILFMPYLHYEYTSRRESMADTIDKVREGIRSAPPRPQANTPDQNSLWAYLRRDIPLHIRRTLDQFYYDALDSDTPQKTGVPPRNQDQVTQRFMRAQEEWKHDDPLMLMVDQLWMVLLEDDTLITAFPQRWGLTDQHEVNPIKDADIANMVAKELSNRDRPPLDSPYDMMMLILKLCTGVLFDAAVHRNEKLRFFEFFERKVQQVTNEEAETFFYLKTKFQQLSKTNKARDRNENLRALLDELLDITDEVDMLNEVKDIHDELYMISQVFDQQMLVLNQMGELLEYRPSSAQDPQISVPPHVIKKWKKLQIEIEQRRDHIAEMDANAHRTFKNINNLFDMKQRQANVLEAHYSRKVAQDSGRQSTTIMVFTIVTIIFLPLSFMSSFFAISVKEFPRDRANQNQLYMSLSYVSARVFGIGISIAVLVVLLAFGINESMNRSALSSFLFPHAPSSSSASSTTHSRDQAPSSLPSSVAASLTTSAASRSSPLTSLRHRGTALLRTADGRRFTIKPKRVVAERQDGVSLFSYNSIVQPKDNYSGGGAGKRGTAVVNDEKDGSGGGSSPSTRSWWSGPWRSSPALAAAAAQARDAESERALERNIGSWDVGVAGSRQRRWASWRARMMGNQRRVSTV